MISSAFGGGGGGARAACPFMSRFRLSVKKHKNSRRGGVGEEFINRTAVMQKHITRAYWRSEIPCANFAKGPADIAH